MPNLLKYPFILFTNFYLSLLALSWYTIIAYLVSALVLCSTDSVFCSSHNRRHKVKKVPRRSPPLDANYQPNEDESADNEKAVTDMVADSYQDTESDGGADSNAVIENPNGADFGGSNLSVEMKNLVWFYGPDDTSNIDVAFNGFEPIG